TLHKSSRNLIEPQTRLRAISFVSGVSFKHCDINSNPFPIDLDTRTGEISLLTPRWRKPPGDRFDDGQLLLLQIPHMRRTAAPGMASFFSALSARFASRKGKLCTCVRIGISAAMRRKSSPSCRVLFAT